MGGTVSGGLRAAKTNKEKYGTDFYKLIGAKGGKKTGLKGFALMDKQKVREAGRLGGKNSRRNRVKETV